MVDLGVLFIPLVQLKYKKKGVPAYISENLDVKSGRTLGTLINYSFSLLFLIFPLDLMTILLIINNDLFP